MSGEDCISYARDAKACADTGKPACCLTCKRHDGFRCTLPDTTPLGIFLAELDEAGDERDMYTDYTDELAIAYVGDDTMTRTAACQEHFAAIWNLPVQDNGKTATILINDREDAERLNDRLMEFFACAAGFCSCRIYDQYFTATENEEN